MKVKTKQQNSIVLLLHNYTTRPVMLMSSTRVQMEKIKYKGHKKLYIHFDEEHERVKEWLKSKGGDTLSAPISDQHVQYDKENDINLALIEDILPAIKESVLSEMKNQSKQ